MKRIISILLSVLLLGMLTACNPGVDLPADGKLKVDKATIEIGETHTSFEGMNIQIVNAVWNDEEIKLDINWENETSYEVVYGASFDKAGATQKKTYGLTDTFDISQNGKYRLTTDCFLYDKGRGGGSTECEMWAEFTVTRIGDTSKDVKKSFIDFETQYVRTDGYYEDVEYPIVKIIRSVDELNAYYNENKDKYSLERRTDPASDSTIGFLDASDKYSAEYFEKQILVMVLLEEGSGSTRHNVDNVKLGSDGKLYVNIRSIDPEVGTCDMAEWHILIEPEADVDVAKESDVIVYLDGINPKTQPTVVREGGGFSNITVTIPHNWEYETEQNADSGEYCIAFWPEGQTEGKIKVWYYNAFGVCGTGLEQEEITLGNYKAWKGTYDNKEYWDFISFKDTPSSYVIMNEGADKWLGDYEAELMQILDTIKVAEGAIGEDEAIEIAKKAVDIEYDEVRARFDSTNECWRISFHKKNASASVKDIVMTLEGKILDDECLKLKEVPQ